MPVTVFLMVLIAAALHATWNAIVKGADDKLLTTILVTSAAGIIAGATLPFLTQPTAVCWPFIAASAFLQIGYFILVASAYRVADMSQAYPLMRGTAPLLVAVMSAAVFGERLSVTAWTGVCLICFGILSLTLSARREGTAHGAGLALLNAGVIAAYTLVDGLGVRRSGASIAYTMWIFLLTAPPLAAWAIVTKRATFGRNVAKPLRFGMIGGVGTVASYGLALWAMMGAPVAIVAALRETSILFATAIAAFVLKEPVSGRRITAVCVIAIGAAVLRLA
jgi:drug/metabolite transporter (DMT)-like permease